MAHGQQTQASFAATPPHVTDAPAVALPRAALHADLQSALAAELGQRYADTDPMIARSRSADHDLQANAAMSLAKQTGRNPRELGAALAAHLTATGQYADVQVAGPGFINVRLLDQTLTQYACAALRSDRLGVPATPHPRPTVIDYSSPNVAKEMQVWHLRSTVIGDALVRILKFCGHPVTRQNHLGDWGTQFGMLLEHLRDSGQRDIDDFDQLTGLYKTAKQRFDTDPQFADRARRRVVALQAGDAESVADWQRLVDVSVAHISELYARMDVTLTDEDLRGESFYNPLLADTVSELQQAQVVRPDQGALTAEIDGQDAPLIVRKSDGGFGYAATDLAALRYRTGEIGARRLVYVTDARQSDHFQAVFQTARKAGWLSDDVSAEHAPFGTVLGEDGKPFKTRSGTTLPLGELLDQAVARARKLVDERSPALPQAEREQIAQAVGIGAVKYADLSSGRQRDYTFSFDRMLAMTGNTAPYLQYAHVRAAAVQRKAAAIPPGADAQFTLTDPAERELALKASELTDAVIDAADRLEPHRLCTYLYELADAFTTFYEHCPVLRADDPHVRATRVMLCRLAERTLAQGLDLLGIRTLARM